MQTTQEKSFDKENLIKAFDPLLAMNQQLLERAENFLIETPEDLVKATDLKKEITTQEKAVWEREDWIVWPAKQFVKAVTGYAKEVTEPLAKAKQAIVDKVLAYNKAQEEARRQEQERIRQEQAELARKQAEEQAKIDAQRLENERKQKELEAKANELSEAEKKQQQKELSIEKARLEIEEQKKQQQAEKDRLENEEKAKIDQARIEAEAQANKPKGIRTVWKFEIVDAVKIPRAFLEVNEVKIRQAIQIGTREIEGVRIYSENIIW